MIDEKLDNKAANKAPRRKRGQGRIWLRESTWWIQYYANGIQQRESAESENREAAERLLAKRRAEIDADTFTGPAARRLRFDDMRDALYSDYKVNGRKSFRTGRDGKPYVCGVSHVEEFFLHNRALAITTSRIREYITRRQAAKASNGTINRELALLRRMFTLAVQDGTLRAVPYFPMLKESAPRKGFFEHTDFQRLRQELPEYLRPIATMGYYTGMRLGEILKVRWSNVDLSIGEIRLDPGETKNDEPRTIPLVGELRDMLKIEREKHPDGEFVFVRAGERIGSFYKAWKSACGRSKLRGLLFHDFRRTGVRNLVRAGVPEHVAMEISGHKTQAVFKRYNIVSGRDLKDAAAKLESYLVAQGKGRRSRHAEKGDNSGAIAESRQAPGKPMRAN
jgi:integrase